MQRGPKIQTVEGSADHFETCYRGLVQRKGSEVSCLPGFELQLGHLLAEQPWPTYLTFTRPSFLIGKLWMIIVTWSTLEDHVQIRLTHVRNVE